MLSMLWTMSGLYLAPWKPIFWITATAREKPGRECTSLIDTENEAGPTDTKRFAEQMLSYLLLGTPLLPWTTTGLKVLLAKILSIGVT